MHISPIRIILEILTSWLEKGTFIEYKNIKLSLR